MKKTHFLFWIFFIKIGFFNDICMHPDYQGNSVIRGREYLHAKYFHIKTTLFVISGSFKAISWRPVWFHPDWLFADRWTMSVCNQPPRSTLPVIPWVGKMNTSKCLGVNQCTTSTCPISQYKLVSGLAEGFGYQHHRCAHKSRKEFSAVKWDVYVAYLNAL